MIGSYSLTSTAKCTKVKNMNDAKREGGARIGTYKDETGATQAVFTLLDMDTDEDGIPWFADLLTHEQKERMRHDGQGWSFITDLEDARSSPLLEPIVENSNVTKTAAQKRYRNRVMLFIHDKKGRVLVSKKPDGNYDFPGGGTDGQAVDEAAKREALEEVGWEVDNVSSLGITPHTFDWPDDFKKKQQAKGRDHDGHRSFFRHAEAIKRDKSDMGSEGDAMKNLKFVPIDEVIEQFKRRAALKDNAWSAADKVTAKALQALSSKLRRDLGEAMVLKAASLLV